MTTELVAWCPPRLWLDLVDLGPGGEVVLPLWKDPPPVALRPANASGRAAPVGEALVYVAAWGRVRWLARVAAVCLGVEGFGLVFGLVLDEHAGLHPASIIHPLPWFLGWRERWWKREEEVQFPRWPADARWVADGVPTDISFETQRRLCARRAAPVQPRGVMSCPRQPAPPEGQLGLFGAGGARRAG